MMRIEYLQADSSEHFNVDVYPPGRSTVGNSADRKLPAIVIATGGAGKDLLTGDGQRGKYAAAYHDLAEHLASDGFWVVVPSRRGDPQRTRELRSHLCPLFQERLPTELFADHGPNEGAYTHRRQAAELETVIQHLPELCDGGVNLSRVGLLGKSVGCGISLHLASEIAGRVSALALWSGSLNSSQWFIGPKADDFFARILDNRQIRYERESFLRDLCNAVDFVGRPTCPILFACSSVDPYAPEPPERDPYSTPEEQLQFLHYAVNTRKARVTIIKGTEHTMYRELPAWQNYATVLADWFKQTLLHNSEAGLFH